MTRFQKLAATTVAGTLLLVTIGVIVRSTDSGLGCPDWPFCYGQLLPAMNDPKAWIEWLHRTVAAVLGLLIVAQAFVAYRDHRDRRSLLWGSLGAVALVGFQAYLGRQTVLEGNTAESVTAHLATSQALLGLLVYLLVRSYFPARIGGRGSSQRFTLLAAFGAAATYALLLFGSQVTAAVGAHGSLVFPDWPLMGGTLFPPLTDLTSAEVLHRWVAIIVGLIVAAIAIAAVRTQRDHPVLVRLALSAAAVYLVQAIVGGLQVVTGLAAWTQTLHVALGALSWALMIAVAVAAYYTARVTPAIGSGLTPGAGRTAPGGDGEARPATTADTIRAYVALTKPRIIELLLVTTVPAMVLAARDVPGMGIGSWSWLVVWTLVGGSLAAGSANAINCYLDRDIDLLMVRTRRRPLPAHQVEPERAVVFGIVLGVVSLVVMAWFVNLVAAFLTLLAIAFYVVVYTMMLKRTTPQNIVIGGAAGALPPVIGWAAVTGSVALPALILFAHRLLLDAAPLLGAVAADPQGLRGGAGPDAAGRPRDPRDDPPDRALHAPARGHLARPVRGRPDGPHLPRGGGRPRRDLRLAGPPAVAGRHVRGGLDRRRHPAVPLLDHVPDPAVRRGRGRRAGRDPALGGPRPGGTGPPRSASGDTGRPRNASTTSRGSRSPPHR